MGSIQILRGIAVLFVVILHVTHKLQIVSNSNHYFSVGAIGVDLFFVISGFIMMYATEKKNNILEFLLDRFFRIYPIFWFFALVTLSIYFFRPDLVNSHSGKELSYLSTFTLIPLQNKMNIILVSWTLSYEIYYYIIFSIAMLLNKYLSINKILSSSLIIFISLFVGFVLNNDFLKNTVILEFIFGMLAYGVFKKDNIKKNIPLDIVCLFIISFGFPIFINFYLNGQEIEFSSSRFLVYGIPMLFLFITFIKYQYVGFFSKTLSLIGNASYSIYLSHILTLNAVLFLVNKINIKIDWVVLAIAMVVLSVLSGLIFYLFFERKFNFMYKNVFKKRFLFRKVI